MNDALQSAEHVAWPCDNTTDLRAFYRSSSATTNNARRSQPVAVTIRSHFATVSVAKRDALLHDFNAQIGALRQQADGVIALFQLASLTFDEHLSHNANTAHATRAAMHSLRRLHETMCDHAMGKRLLGALHGVHMRCVRAHAHLMCAQFDDIAHAAYAAHGHAQPVTT
jgi:hypothetical protein